MSRPVAGARTDPVRRAQPAVPARLPAHGHRRYGGETRPPLILQNSHRYFFYAAGIIALINAYDATLAFRTADGEFGLGLGNVILWLTVILLAGYTFGCHSWRHIVGGRLKHFSRHPVRYRAWLLVSKLNAPAGSPTRGSSTDRKSFAP
jgi:hypothetical protein